MNIAYTKLSLSQLSAETEALAREAQTLCGPLNELRLNWRPSAAQWSVAQCLEHLLKANGEMFSACDKAVGATQRQTIWQCLPVWPHVFGWLLITSQSPNSKQKFKANQPAQPASNAIDVQIVSRFLAQQRELIERMQALEDAAAARVVMISPFVRFITYSLLDGYRLIVAHERRHIEQARRVTQAPGFPA